MVLTPEERCRELAAAKRLLKRAAKCKRRDAKLRWHQFAMKHLYAGITGKLQ